MLVSETYELEDVNYYDSVTTDKTSNYQVTQIQSSNLPTITYTDNSYLISGGTNTNCFLLPSQYNNVQFEAEIKVTNYRMGLGFLFSNKTIDIITLSVNSNELQSWRYTNGSWQESYKSTKTINANKEWVKLILERQGTTVNVTVKDIDTDTVISTWNRPLQSSVQVYCALGSGGVSNNGYVRKIKVKAL